MKRLVLLKESERGEAGMRYKVSIQRWIDGAVAMRKMIPLYHTYVFQADFSGM
jgi:hypothetical protein